MEKIYYLNFPHALHPFLSDDGGIICLADKMPLEEPVEQKPTKIVIWQDLALARELEALPELHGLLWIALPLNIGNAPYNYEYIQYRLNYEYIQYRLAEPLPADSVEASPADGMSHLRQLRELSGIHELSREYLYRKKYLRKSRILLVLDGDESEEEEKGILERIRRENPRKKLKLIRLDSDAFLLSLKKSAKMFPYYEIFEVEKVYTVKSVAALYFSIFCKSVHFRDIVIEKDRLFADGPATPIQELVLEFYFRLCRNKLLDNADSLLTDIMDPFSRLLMGRKPWDIRLGNLLRDLDGLLKKSVNFSFLHNQFIKRMHTKSLLRHLNDSACGKEACPREALKLFSSIPLLKDRERNLQEYERSGRHDLAISLGHEMLRNNQISPKTLRLLAAACFSTGNFELALRLSRLGEAKYPDLNNGEFEYMSLRFLLLQNLAIDSLCQLVKYSFTVNQGNINLTRFRLDNKLSKFFGDFNWQLVFSLLRLSRCRKDSLQKANLLYGIRNYDEAAEILEKISGLPAAVKLFTYYTDTCQLEKAKRVLEKRLRNAEDNPDLTLAFHIAACDRQNIRAFLASPVRNAQLKNYGSRYMAHMILEEICLAFKVFSKSSHFHMLDKYFPDNLVSTLYSDMEKVEKAVVFSECFVGDELRYSRMYPAIAEKIKAKNCVFTCDKRIETILKRSFPSLSFHPLNKTREIDLADNPEDYAGLPGLELARFMDTDAWNRFRDYDRVCTVVAGLTGTVRSYESLSSLPYLKYDPELKASLRARLQTLRAAKGKTHVAGLSWRSSISDPKRARFFLDRELLLALLALPDIQWISCQYDGLKPREKDFFKNFSNFTVLEDINLFNDIEAAAALFGALDIMVSAPIFSADMAAAVGTATIAPMPGDSFSVYCRPGTNRAIFDANYEYMNYKKPGGVEELVNRVHELLNNPYAEG